MVSYSFSASNKLKMLKSLTLIPTLLPEGEGLETPLPAGEEMG
jgi:hypothetical protein